MDRAARRLEAMSQQNPGRIRDLEQVDEQALEREERAENSAAQADALLAQVQLSTIQLAIYQHDETRLDTLKRPLHEIWVEPVWRRFARAFSEGWEGILDVALWFASHWITVLVLALVAVFLRRRMSSKKS